MGQVAHFKIQPLLRNSDLLNGLNSNLPPDIRILSLRKAPPEFHARRSAGSKIYGYRIVNAPRVSPFDIRYVHHWRGRLDVAAMRKAARLFVREADFSPFSSNRLLHPVRNVMRSRISRRGTEILYTVEANGFLRYMVRSMVGTLLEIGRGRIEPEAVEELFQGAKRTLASPTAPAKGLCLIKVIY
jgi:tRNA pseudouridine38-40 synthase